MTFQLNREQTIGRPRDEVFAFFEDARNLERITPPFLRFTIATPSPIAMREGALIDYRLALFGVPFRWRTRIDSYVPGVEFIDSQLRGPFALWRHTHSFRDTPEGTHMHDRVEYAIPAGPLGTLAHTLFVRQTLARVFDYRHKVISEIFSSPKAASFKA